jgi:hypothetical protein
MHQDTKADSAIQEGEVRNSGTPAPQGLVFDIGEHAHHGLQRRQRQVQAVHVVLAEGGHPHLRPKSGAVKERCAGFAPERREPARWQDPS